MPHESDHTVLAEITKDDEELVDDVMDEVGFNTYLLLRKPTVIVRVDTENPENSRAVLSKPVVRSGKNIDDSDMVHNPNAIIIAPLNTDIRFGKTLSHRSAKTLREAYTDDIPSDDIPLAWENKLSDPIAVRNIQKMEEGILDDSNLVPEVASDALIIPPLNTDIRISSVLPEFDMSSFTSNAHPHEHHDELLELENFSWHLITDTDADKVKFMKSLMHPVQNQHMCGSCWAMALSSCVSDCHVVAGIVTWMPRIAPTYLMANIPTHMGNSRCDGGNPALTARALETMKVSDTTCIDYSWCTNDGEVCTSASAANHFKSALGAKLNKNIPQGSACYFQGERYLYQVDKGTEAIFIDDALSADDFQSLIKRHIVEFGPPLAGYAVLSNFITGNFTDPRINQGVYFDRASYSSRIRQGEPLVFNNMNASLAKLSGLHAVEVVGWGLARGVQYDTDKYGDVPFWWAKNSWGSSWGNMGGYFKMAMYPWNKFGQFGKQIRVKGGNVGGMILVRCTTPPTTTTLPALNQNTLSKIVRSMSDDYYKTTPEDIKNEAPPVIIPPRAPDDQQVGDQSRGNGGMRRRETPGLVSNMTSTTEYSWVVYVAIAVILALVAIYFMSRK